MPRTMTAAEFKARCLELMDRVAREREPIIVTKRGKPVARMMPVRQADNSKLIGSMRGKVTVRGNIFSTGRKWDAQSRHPRSGLAYHR